MTSFFQPLLWKACAFTGILFLTASTPQTDPTPVPAPASDPPRIQAAILLDVSSSMDGLIEQAKAQLWNMVGVMGRAQCNNATPQIEIALYEYGRSSNNAKEGYVKRLSPFTGDLDGLSKILFSLTTNGGDEYCGHVMYTSLRELSWDTASTSYKVIFIAGNEDFLQGNVTWTRSCAEARQKGVIVNTIYCGDRMQGIKEHWNLSSECGSGSYTHINQGAAIEDIPTPYDSAIFTLNGKLNGTYLAYGYEGQMAMAQQGEVDTYNLQMNKSVAAKRVAIKGKKELYKNTGWDLVDAYDADSTFLVKLDRRTLSDSLRNKSDVELKRSIKAKAAERSSVQAEIAGINAKREAFIATERAKNATSNQAPTLESEIEKMIREQAKRYNMIIQ